MVVYSKKTFIKNKYVSTSIKTTCKVNKNTPKTLVSRIWRARSCIKKTLGSKSGAIAITISHTLA